MHVEADVATKWRVQKKEIGGHAARLARVSVLAHKTRSRSHLL